MKRKTFRSIISSLSSLNDILVILLFTVLLLNNCTNKGNSKSSAHKIVIEATISKYFLSELKDIFSVKDEIPIYYTSFRDNHININRTLVPGRVLKNKVRWTIYTDKALLISPPFGTSIIMNPGDSVHILYLRNFPEYSGKNSSTLALLDTLMFLAERVPKPEKKYSFNVASLEDFFEWNQYLNNRLEKQLPAIDLFENKISPEEYRYYKSDLIGKIEADRIKSFTALHSLVMNGYPGLTSSNLIHIWDSTQNNLARKWLHSLDTYNGSITAIYSFIRMEIRRQFGFNGNNDSLRRKDIYTQALYSNAKQKYKGEMRERLLVHILDEQTITEMGLKNIMTQTLLKDYYSQSEYPEYKKWVKELEKKKLDYEQKRDKKKSEKEKEQKEG